MTHISSADAVTVDEVLSHLMTRSMVPSPLGSMLARMRDGVTGGTHSPVAVSDSMHRRLLSQAAVLRCVEALVGVERFGNSFCKRLRDAAKETGHGEGYVVVAVMRAYQQWSNLSVERAYAAVAHWAHMEENQPDDETADKLAESFRIGKRSAVRARAKGLEAECRMMLTSWVKDWNRKR